MKHPQFFTVLTRDVRRTVRPFFADSWYYFLVLAIYVRA